MGGALSATALPASARNAHSMPNIFYICVDDLGTYLNCYGNKQVISPNFDAFAQDSVLFENAHCQVAVCTASRTSILTGVRPEISGLTHLNHDWKQSLPEVASLPEHLQSGGYNTISVGKIWDPRSGPGSQIGWTEKVQEWGIKDNRNAIRLIQKYLDSDKPNAFFIGYKAPHCPWQPAEKYEAQYQDAELDLNGPGRTINAPYLQKCSGINKQHISDADAYDITRRYYASVTEVDALIGELISEIKRLKLYQDSIIVLWSGDHGYHLGENDHWGKWTNYASSTRVPMMIRTPNNVLAGHRVSDTVECVDMYPTLAELTGLNFPKHKLGGSSLLPFLEKNNHSWEKPAFSIWEEPDADDPARGVSYSVKTKRYNYILYKNGAELLFDHSRDPKEEHNIAAEHTEICQKLKQLTLSHFSLS